MGTTRSAAPAQYIGPSGVGAIVMLMHPPSLRDQRTVRDGTSQAAMLNSVVPTRV